MRHLASGVVVVEFDQVIQRFVFRAAAYKEYFSSPSLNSYCNTKNIGIAKLARIRELYVDQYGTCVSSSHTVPRSVSSKDDRIASRETRATPILTQHNPFLVREEFVYETRSRRFPAAVVARSPGSADIKKYPA